MKKEVILIVDDDATFINLLRSTIREDRYDVVITNDSETAGAVLRQVQPLLVIIDIGLWSDPRMGLIFIQEAIRKRPDTLISVVSNTAEFKTIDEALNMGAIDYLVKENRERLSSQIQRLIRKVELELEINRGIEEKGGFQIDSDQIIVGTSPVMRHIYKLITQVTVDGSAVLVIGDSGTGKELIAKAIHARKKIMDPFISINCGCLTKSLLESELFGIRAFYPGMHNRERLVGKFEAADRGTLLLDEIGNMDIDLQPALLRVLQEREFRPLGTETSIPLHAQIISSTNVDLEAAIKIGRFREDLYYRLNAVRIIAPPLHKRQEDIPLIVSHLLGKHTDRTGQRAEIVPEAMEKLISYPWPGNVRELVQVLRRALITSQSQYLVPSHFVLSDRNYPSSRLNKKFYESVTEFQKEIILEALTECNWNRTEAAKRLGLHRGSLIHLMKKVGVTDNEPKPTPN